MLLIALRGLIECGEYRLEFVALQFERSLIDHEAR
jgi:hypothetical protein